MRSAFFGLHVATSGLHTARGALNVTSHNLANSQIPGYSRQVAQMQAGRPLTVGSGRGMYGTGSQITAVIQIRDRFLDRKFWNQNALSGQFSAVNQNLTFVETVFNQVNDVGVKRTFNSFFSTLQDLTTRAHESTFRTGVLENSSSLSEQIRQNAFSLQRQQADLNREFADVIVTINNLGQQIADLNRQIHIFERDGSNANDLRDQRARLVDQLSGLVNVQVDERDFSRPGMGNDRRFSVMINGQDFVDHTRLNRLELVPRNHPADERSGPSRNEMDVHGLYDVFFTLTGSRFNIHSPQLSGKLRGIVDVRDGNGGQPTVAPMLTGRMMLQTQLSALDRTLGFVNNIDARMNFLGGATGLPAWAALRDGAFARINATAPTAPVTTTAEANAWLTNRLAIQTERNNLQASLPSLRTTLNSDINITNLLNSVRAALDTDNYAGGGTINGMLENISSILADINAVNLSADDFSAADFRALLTSLEDEVAGLHDALEAAGTASYFDGAAILTSLSNFPTRLVQFRTTLDRLDEIATNYPTLDEDIEEIIEAIEDLRTATGDISEITTLSDRLHTQLYWAMRNAESMIHAVEARIAQIEAGIAHGYVEDYEEFLALLRDELETMRTVIDALEDIESPDVYASIADLAAFIDELRNNIDASGEGLADFTASIAAIYTAADVANNPAALLGFGTSIPITPTTNFKGIPFYMNQLNELVRTFARAINEGLNRYGEPIRAPIGRNPNGTNIYANAVGHVFGYNANGVNGQDMFFTFEDRMGNASTLTSSDPLRSLRMWVMSELDADGNPTGVPARDENGNLITVQDPNPPVMINADGEPVFLTAMDSRDNPMFTIDYSQFNALNFIVNPDLLNDPSLLAASSNANIGQANNDIIHGFLAVGNDSSLFREGRLIDFIIATSSHLAVDNQQAKRFSESYSEITTQTHNHRLSVKSVDTEEEMLNMVRFQNMFIATSRLINVLDTVYDTLINRLGNF